MAQLPRLPFLLPSEASKGVAWPTQDPDPQLLVGLVQPLLLSGRLPPCPQHELGTFPQWPLKEFQVGVRVPVVICISAAGSVMTLGSFQVAVLEPCHGSWAETRCLSPSGVTRVSQLAVESPCCVSVLTITPTSAHGVHVSSRSLDESGCLGRACEARRWLSSRALCPGDRSEGPGEPRLTRLPEEAGVVSSGLLFLLVRLETLYFIPKKQNGFLSISN